MTNVFDNYPETIIVLERKKKRQYTCCVSQRQGLSSKWKRFKRKLGLSMYDGNISFYQLIAKSLGNKENMNQETWKWWSHPKREWALNTADNIIYGNAKVKEIRINIYLNHSEIIVIGDMGIIK